MPISLTLLILPFLLVSCFKVPIQSKGAVTAGNPVGLVYRPTEISNTKSMTSVSANATEPMKLAVSSSNELQGTSITIAPGSLQIAANIVIEQGADFADTSIGTEVGLAADLAVTQAGNGVIIRPSEDAVLSKPIQLNLPLPILMGAHLAGIQYGIIYKYQDPDSKKLLTGLKPVDGLSVKLMFDTDASRDTVQFDGYFGIYWVVILSRPVVAAEIAAPKESVVPIVNKANTTVMTVTGVVKEAEIAVTQALPELVWPTPVLTFDPKLRKITLSAETAADFPASKCKADLFKSNTDLQGQSLDTGAARKAVFPVESLLAQKFVGRFICQDAQARATLSPWSEPLALDAYEFASVVSVSSSNAAGLYGTGTDISLAVSFSGPVTVSGQPTLKLATGGTGRNAVYVSGSGTNVLLFKYTVAAGDESADLTYATSSELQTDGTSRVQDANGWAAILTLPDPSLSSSFTHQNALVVDGVAPSLPTAIGFVNPNSSIYALTFHWTAATDTHFQTHQVKLCPLNDCSCNVTPVATPSSPATLNVTSDGSYFACVKATDTAGQETPYVASANSVLVNTVYPTVNAGIDVLTNSLFTSAASVTGAVTYQWSQVSGPGTVSFTAPTAQNTQIAAVGDGQYVLRLTATNSSGLSSNDDINFKWDTTPPVFSGLYEVARRVSPSEAWLYWKPATDNMSGPAHIIYEICQSQTPGQCASSFTVHHTTGPRVWDYPITGLSGSDYEFAVRARDAAGNVSTNPISKKNDVLTGINKISASYTHSCAIVGGLVRCWGKNDVGQLGNGTLFSSPSPVTVTGLTNMVSVAVGPTHSCAVSTGGDVYCWGSNTNSQLGNGLTLPSLVPVQVASLGGAATEVGVGGNFTCAIVSGDIKCWGLNANGQIGDGTTSQRNVPTTPNGLTGGFHSLAVGPNHSCAIKLGGLYCWGMNTVGQLGTPTNPTLSPYSVGYSIVSDVAVGTLHTCFLFNSGEVRCFGGNALYQLGNGTTTNASSAVATSITSNGIDIAAGGDTTCARVAGNTVKCWGANTKGQVGVASVVNITSPADVLGLSNVDQLAVGQTHTCALLANATAKCWGDNTLGQLGSGSLSTRTSPVRIPNLGGVMEIVSGDSHNCALIGSQVSCWGANKDGQTGNGTTSSHLIPMSISGLSGVSDLASGAGHSCAVQGGTVQCWGRNTFGQLGDNTTTFRSTKITVGGGLTSADKISLGFNHSCAIKTNGQLYCWGLNQNGQLGDGTTTSPRALPVWIIALNGVSAVSAGFTHTCAIADGAANNLYCWGGNTFGQLGRGHNVQGLTPVMVSGMSGALAISVGMNHSCALLSDSRVRCWGQNAQGQLGIGSTNSQTMPVVLGTLNNVVELASGSDHNCAKRADESVYCWGKNLAGQLGDGTYDNRLSPIPIPALFGVNSVRASFDQTFVLMPDFTTSVQGATHFGAAAQASQVFFLGGKYSVAP